MFLTDTTTTLSLHPGQSILMETKLALIHAELTKHVISYEQYQTDTRTWLQTTKDVDTPCVDMQGGRPSSCTHCTASGV